MQSAASTDDIMDSDLNGDSRTDPDPREVPELVIRYVHQLVNGCGNNDCKEVLCRTGTRNTSNGRPVRTYTPRSARTIAIAMCARPHPRTHLCRYTTVESAYAAGNLLETQGPIDPSALDHLLSETRSFKLLQDLGTLCFHDAELKNHHEKVSRAIEAASPDPSRTEQDDYDQKEGLLPNNELLDDLIPAAEWLLAKLPHHRPASYSMVNDLISKGYAYPTKNVSIPADENFNNWLKILDTMHHKPYLRLLGRIVQAVAVRQALDLASESTHRSSLFPGHVSWRPPTTGSDKYFVQRLVGESSSNVFALVVWLKRLAAEHWDGRPEVKIGSVCMAAWAMVHGLANNPERKVSVSEDDSSFYHMPMIWIRLSATELVQSYRVSSPPGPQSKSYHIFEFRTLFSMKQLTLYFRLLNHLKMREANSAVEKSMNIMRRYSEYFPNENFLPEQLKHATKHYLLLNVSRGNVLEDAFDQLWQRRKDELKRPLRVRLGEIEEHEVGHDLGGVQIEFFNLICKEAFSPQAQMFVTDEQTGLSHFKPGSLQPLHMFELFGLLFALAIYNGITLPISLPWVYYRILVGYQGPERAQEAIEELRDGWPVLARSMESVLENDIPDLELAFPFEANGIHMQALPPPTIFHDDIIFGQVVTAHTIHRGDAQLPRRILQVTSTTPEVDFDEISEELPGWKLERAPSEPEEITRENKEKYVKAYASHIVYDSASPQWQAFERGFWGSDLIEQRHLRLFSPAQLKLLVEGTSQLDITALRSATQYDGYSASDPYMNWFWRVVTSWSEAKQKQLLKFVTAAERVPITGGLTFVIKRYDSENKERLPTSSTCFGTLMLPMYRSERVLAQKLSLALKYGSEGFGTG